MLLLLFCSVRLSVVVLSIRYFRIRLHKIDAHCSLSLPLFLSHTKITASKMSLVQNSMVPYQIAIMCAP